jgi:hypothetical protein
LGQGKLKKSAIVEQWERRLYLLDFGYKKHIRVHHGKNEFAKINAHINAIESLWRVFFFSK